jgi:hemerythrin-like metal-binding protein
MLLRKLVDSTNSNFQVEERLMACTNYPKLIEHRARHCELTRRVNEFVSRWEKGEAVIDDQLLAFLRDWLANHIQSDDKQYGPWLNEHGVR